MIRRYIYKVRKGFSLVEVILASALMLLLVTTIITGYLYGQESGILAGKRVDAVFLAQEGLEAARSIQASSFSNLTAGTYGLATSSNVWILSGSHDAVRGYTRELVITDVDAHRKDVTANVTWQQTFGRSGLVSLTTRFTNWMREVIVIGDWSTPTTTSTFNILGNNNGLKVFVQGDYAYVIRQNGSPNLIVFDVSDLETVLIEDQISLTGNLTNIFISGNYAYVASNSNSQELQIVDISDPANLSVIGDYNDAGNHDARGVYVVGTTAYLAMNGGNDLVVVDVSSPSAPTLLGGVALSGSAYEVYVNGNYAYVASNSNSQELQIVDISDPTSLSLVAALNLTGNDNGSTVDGLGSTVVIGRSGNGGVHTIDILNPLVPVELDSYFITDYVRDLGVANSYIFIGSDLNLGEFQILDISDRSDIQFVSSLDVDNDLNGVAYDSAQDIIAAVSDSNSEEFYIFSPN